MGFYLMRLIYLSEKFYERHKGCEEILLKDKRPYACLAIRINTFIFAIPFRHNINHRYAYFTYGKCGLDYTKSVVISLRSDIAPETPIIEQREFDAIKGKERNIYRGLCSYINTYKKALKYQDSPHYQNILKCSSLQYFKEYL